MLAAVLTGVVAMAAAHVVTRVDPPAPESVRCADRSFGRFRDAFDLVDDLVVGPLSLEGLGRPAEQLTAEELLRFGGGTKFGILLRNGHRATVRIDAGARAFARITHAHRGRALEDMPTAVRLRACAKGSRSGSRANGRKVTFWPGWVELRDSSPACVPIHVRIDGGAARAQMVRIGTQAC